MAELPSYDIDLKDLDKLKSPEGNRLTSMQNFTELETYINAVVEWLRNLDLGGGVDIELVAELVRARLKKIVTIPISLSDGSAISDPTSNLTIERSGTRYIINVAKGNEMVVQIRNKANGSVPAVELIKTINTVEINFGVPITNDFEVVLI